MENPTARMLSQEEKPLCRALWQEIFTEDSEAFLDYYDRWKTKENQCYGIFDGDRLVSMLELNPYRLMVQGHEVESRYIIAVATRPEYRHQGLMKRLLKKSLEDMRAEGLPLLYLMPAAEAIYHPFGFRFVYAANAGTAKVCGCGEDRSVECRRTEREEDDDPKSGNHESDIWAEIFGEPERITEEESQDFDRIITEILEFSDRVLPCISDCYTKRDAAYYRTLLAELKSEGGGLIVVRKKNENDSFRACEKEEATGASQQSDELCGTAPIIGLVPFWGGEKPEIREILSLPEDGELVLKTVVSEIAGNHRFQPLNTAAPGAEIPVMGASFPMDEKKPIIMARICHAERFLEMFHLKRDAESPETMSANTETTAGRAEGYSESRRDSGEAERQQELEIHLTDTLIPENSGVYRWHLTEYGGHAEKLTVPSEIADTAGTDDAAMQSWKTELRAAALPESEKSGSGNHDTKPIFCTEAELVSWLLGNQTEGFPEQVQTCQAPFINEIV